LSHDDKQVHVVLDTPTVSVGSRPPICRLQRRTLLGAQAGWLRFPGIDSTVLGRVARLKLAHGAHFPAATNNEHGKPATRWLHDGWVRVRLNERDDNTPGARGGDRDRSAVTVQELRDAIQRVYRVDVAITEIEEGRRFRDNSRQAATYRKGQVLLAGDARPRALAVGRAGPSTSESWTR